MPDTTVVPKPFNWRESIPHLQSVVLLHERMETDHVFISWGSGPRNRTLEHDEREDGRDWFATRAMPNNYERTARFETMDEGLEWLQAP
jgi:hypothetical protein